MGTGGATAEKPNYHYTGNKKIRSTDKPKILTSGFSESQTIRYMTSEDMSTQPSGEVSPIMGVGTFDMVKILGKGTLGKVTLVKHKPTGELYAMKSIQKPIMQTEYEKEQVLAERNLMLRIKHPFIVTLQYSFQTSHKLFFVFDYLKGGTLESLIKKKGKLDEKRIKKYLGELILALEYLHQNDVVGTDLNPQNILFDSDGHAMLTDFGISKLLFKQDDTSYVEKIIKYKSPESLLEDKVNHGADWWGLGIIFYQMLFGKLPFGSQNLHQIFDTITNKDIPIPEDQCSKQAKELLEKLLIKDPKKRIGKEDANEIMGDPYFDSVNWHDILHKKNDFVLSGPYESSGSPTKANHALLTNRHTGLETPIPSGVLNTESYKDVHLEGFTFLGDDIFTLDKKNTIRKNTSDSDKLI